MPEKLLPEIPLLVRKIKDNEALLSTKKITAGFDGFIDTIVRVVRNKDKDGTTEYFTTIKEFGDYTLEKQAASFSLEIKEISQKPGGNMPIMANALGRMGIAVNCIGALGYPETHPVFKNTFPASCSMYSFANPGTSTAYEFTDGKMMMANMGGLNETGWDNIKKTIGIDTLIRLYEESDMICQLNWSEIDASTDIWKGLLQDVFPKYNRKQKQILFIDLSDCSKRSTESITEALVLMQQFSAHTKLILSLNKNEARLIHSVLYNQAPGDDVEETGKKIFEKINPEVLLLHSSKQALAFKQGISSCQSFFIKNPLVSTGAGDNFNAGFAAAQLLELDPAHSLLFAHAVAALYISSGISPAISETIGFLTSPQTPLQRRGA